MTLTAIVIALNEEPFIRPCLEAIYPFVHRIIVVTNYDTDYQLRALVPDGTLQAVLSFPDPDRKLHVIISRAILDEVLQRNWALNFDEQLFALAQGDFRPHAWALDDIRLAYRRTDYYWVIDADEIYDPATVPAIVDFVERANGRNIVVRGFNHFKKWNYRINGSQFWQLGFIRPGTKFYSRRTLYHFRPLGWLHRIHHRLAGLQRAAIDRATDQIRVPEEVGYFSHGSYIGDESRMRKKLATSSHAAEHAPYANTWMESVWSNWEPGVKNFYFPSQPDEFDDVTYVPTSKLPGPIRSAVWPDGWIDP